MISMKKPYILELKLKNSKYDEDDNYSIAKIKLKSKKEYENIKATIQSYSSLNNKTTMYIKLPKVSCEIATKSEIIKFTRCEIIIDTVNSKGVIEFYLSFNDKPIIDNILELFTNKTKSISINLNMIVIGVN